MTPREYRMATDFTRKPWSERLVLFLLVFIFWMILAWPVSEQGGVLINEVLLGAVAAAVVAVVMRAMFRQNFIRLLNPRSWFWGVVYVPVFSWYVLKGGMEVVYRVLHPAMPIHPGIVRVKSTLKSDTGRIALATSITLTPGTLTVEVTGDGVFYVHWLNVASIDDEEAAVYILRRFEWFMQRIFE